MPRIRAITCEVMRDEWSAVNDHGIPTCFLEQGLHRHPEKLREQVQAAIDKIEDADVILLGYGLCSNALTGIHSRDKTLVLPLVEDCIGLFLGSAAAYAEQFRAEPATYYFTKGWVVAKKDPYQEYLQSCERWGEEEADWIAREMMKNYQRAAYIDTYCYEIGEYHEYARKFAEFFRLKLEKLPGSLELLQEILSGNWDRCLVVKPGEVLTEARFREALARVAGQ